jgi:geranyl-CoA carboxylase alpha subunit
VRSGQQIPPFYDPMGAKLSAWGETREEARRRLVDGLADTALFGVANNRGFLIDCLEAETMAAGEATTAFLAESGLGSARALAPSREALAAGAVLQVLAAGDDAHARSILVSPGLLDWWSAGVPRTRLSYRPEAAHHPFDVTVAARGGDHYDVTIADAESTDEVAVEVLSRQPPEAALRLGGRRRRVLFLCADSRVHLTIGRETVVLDDLLTGPPAAEDEAGSGRVVAPMHGSVVEIVVAVGETVRVGARVAVVEAMKMQHALTAGVDGEVTAVAVKVGQQVAAGDLLVEIAELDPDGAE